MSFLFLPTAILFGVIDALITALRERLSEPSAYFLPTHQSPWTNTPLSFTSTLLQQISLWLQRDTDPSLFSSQTSGSSTGPFRLVPHSDTPITTTPSAPWAPRPSSARLHRHSRPELVPQLSSSGHRVIGVPSISPSQYRLAASLAAPSSSTSISQLPSPPHHARVTTANFAHFQYVNTLYGGGRARRNSSVETLPLYVLPPAYEHHPTL